MTTPDLFREYVNQPWVPPVVSDEAMRTAMGYVPVAGTMYNWNQMAPWERGLSIGLDAVDIATLGGGKAITAPARAGVQGFRHFAKTPVPTYMRFGDILHKGGQYRPSHNWGVTDLPERGISVYPAMYDPGVDKYVIQSAPDVNYLFRNPKHYDPVTEVGKSSPTFSGVQTKYEDLDTYMDASYIDWLGNDIRDTQNMMVSSMKNVPRWMQVEDGTIWARRTPAEEQRLQDLYSTLKPFEVPYDPDIVGSQTVLGGFPRRVEGTPIPGQVGSDFEPLIHPKSLDDPFNMYPNRLKEGAPGSTTRIDPSRVVMSDEPAQTLREHGRLIDIPGSPRQIPRVEFNVDEYGKHIPTTGDKILTQLEDFMRNYTSPGGFSLAQLGTLAARGELNAPQER